MKHINPIPAEQLFGTLLYPVRNVEDLFLLPKAFDYYDNCVREQHQEETRGERLNSAYYDRYVVQRAQEDFDKADKVDNCALWDESDLMFRPWDVI
jgi:hypothetical protein